jgi:nitrite reductase/ring-hydroxylating ferredoxin subunit
MWHRLGGRDEVLARAPYAVKVDRYTVAVFFHAGAFRAIGNGCNHKGGPLCEGRMRARRRLGVARALLRRPHAVLSEWRWDGLRRQRWQR